MKKEDKDQDIQRAINRLMSEEWFAGQMYKQFILLVDPSDRHLICEKMAEVANDELDDHFKSIAQFAVDNGFDIPANYNEMKRYADKQDVRDFESAKKNQDAMYYIDKAVASEQRAIESYQKYLDDYDFASKFQDFKLILMNAYYDEQQHLKDFQFMKSSIESMGRFGFRPE